MVQVTGNLKDPMGIAIPNAEIRITADATETVIYGLTGSVNTDIAGLYDFNLENGNYMIEVLFKKKYLRAAVVLIDATVPASIDLETLIKDHATFIPNTIDS